MISEYVFSFLSLSDFSGFFCENNEELKRINVKKILNLDEVLNKPYSKVTIELKDDYNLDEIKELLSYKGETEINLIINDKNKQAFYSLQENRKFDLNHLKTLKAKKYVEKITV